MCIFVMSYILSRLQHVSMDMQFSHLITVWLKLLTTHNVTNQHSLVFVGFEELRGSYMWGLYTCICVQWEDICKEGTDQIPVRPEMTKYKWIRNQLVNLNMLASTISLTYSNEPRENTCRWQHIIDLQHKALASVATLL